MKVLNSIKVKQGEGSAVLQLIHGDLSEIPASHAVDILIVSAFPDNYEALPGSLVYSLEQKGLSLQQLSLQKASDLRPTLGCWYSEPLPATLQKKLHFRRILCFEPGTQSDNPVEVVSNIFRCLNNFVFDELNNSAAMPVIASGYQKVPLGEMLPALIEQAVFWLQNGLPLKCIKIFIYRNEEVPPAMSIFEQAKVAPVQPSGVRSRSRSMQVSSPARAGKIKNVLPLPQAQHNEGFDYFISYAHKQTAYVQHFVDTLLKHKPGLRVFYDRTNIRSGGLWIRQLSEAIGKSGKVLIFISPDYSSSMVCWDEFQCAKLKEYTDKSAVIQTIYLQNDPQLPLIFGIHSWIDCREADMDKLAEACLQL